MKNNLASVADWMDVSDSEDDWTIYTADCFDPCYDLPLGWEMLCDYDTDKDRKSKGAQKPIYRYKEFDAKVRGCRNMMHANNKIRKWKKKYQKHKTCPMCHHAPCCLQDLGMLLEDEGENLSAGTNRVQNKCI